MGIKLGNEEFEGSNKPKRTPGHKTKSHAVLAKEGDEVKVKVIGFDRGKVKLSMKQANSK